MKKKKPETSKLLLVYSDTLSLAVTVVSIVAVFKSQNPEPLAYLIPAVFGLSATSHGFYYWKAKAENLNKWGQSDKINDTETGID
ncbi:MAG: hypothetical protein IJI23_00125 [Lachnospiraceae bacterium]|nr:hypothetical protein [Lachnospiraceae bacterium]